MMNCGRASNHDPPIGAICDVLFPFETAGNQQKYEYTSAIDKKARGEVNWSHT
jgi:hypothetical protein